MGVSFLGATVGPCYAQSNRERERSASGDTHSSGVWRQFRSAAKFAALATCMRTRSILLFHDPTDQFFCSTTQKSVFASHFFEALLGRCSRGIVWTRSGGCATRRTCCKNGRPHVCRFCRFRHKNISCFLTNNRKLELHYLSGKTVSYKSNCAARYN